jgi:glycogen debranching enzyme
LLARRVVAIALIRPKTLYGWKGPSLLILNMRGECGDDESLAGYYFRETRFVRTLRFDINGQQPWLCEAASLEPAELAFTYAYPEVAEYGGGGSGQSGDEVPTDRDGIPQRAIAIHLAYTLQLDGLTIAATIANHSAHHAECELGWTVDADFADIQEAQAGKREQHADIETDTSSTGITLTYQHRRLGYRSSIDVTAHANWNITASRIATQIRLEPQTSVDLGLRIHASTADGSPLSDDIDDRDHALHAWRDSFARVSIPGNRAEELVIAKNVRDFASFPLLEGQPDEWLTLQAGMPLYPALFGRDTLTAGWQAAWVDRGQSLDASLTRLGRLQSDRVDPWRDEEPGRIPYQVRRGPLALLEINPYAAYYADYASPFMFVIALGHLYSWTGDVAIVRRHWDSVRRILDWARAFGDRDCDGYLEYQTRSSKGTKNQGWKDSGDAIVYEDGSPVPAPLGTCELQGYWFAAQQLAAVMSWALGARSEGRAHWRSAMALKKRFNRDWWIDDNACVALAMDPDKRPVPAVSSNIGHCIATGIVGKEHLPAAVERLFAPDMFSGWGIRTLSMEHRSYNPMSYHRGSVWPVEQATIAFGLRRFGFDARALELSAALLDLAQLYPEYRIPECVGGYARGDRPTPGAYPQANTPQLWNAAAFPLVVHTILGLQPVAPLNLLVVSPALPARLPEIVLHDIRLADANATLRFWRDADGRSHAEVVKSRGTFRLVEQPPPESLSAGFADRLRALLDTVRH